jgi:hypothetical protein
VFDNLGGRQRLAPQRLGLGNIPVPGTKAGAIVSLGLVIIAWFALPVAQPFILGTVGLGVIVGLFLRWLHSRENSSCRR